MDRDPGTRHLHAVRSRSLWPGQGRADTEVQPCSADSIADAVRGPLNVLEESSRCGATEPGRGASGGIGSCSRSVRATQSNADASAQSLQSRGHHAPEPALW